MRFIMCREGIGIKTDALLFLLFQAFTNLQVFFDEINAAV